MNAQILIIEDDQNAGQALQTLLKKEGYKTDLARDGQSGLNKALEVPYDLVITDIVMPNLDGMSLFKRLRKERPETEIIMMTAHGSIEMAVEAMREGAIDFLEKPLNIERVRIQVAKALNQKNLSDENRQLKKQLNETYALKNLLGEDPKIRKLAQQVRQVAPTQATILILGESGTGKELIANGIHQHSPRKDKPFIKINCAALPEELLQSELFGHTKGAFTGAGQTRKGRFEEADGGTIFLDEIGDLPPSMQVKLLRVLQEGTFERVGDNTTRHTNVRIIAATHVDLEEAIQQGRMREDFYYRIKGITLRIPPLRERIGDIPLLIQNFLIQAGALNKKLSPKALETLCHYSWPGNVRQLKNVCDNLAILASGETIDIDNLPVEILQNLNLSSPTAKQAIELMTMAQAEELLIQKALEKTKGNKTEAARLLDIGLRTLYRKLEKIDEKPSEKLT